MHLSDNIEKFLANQDKSVQFQEKLADIEKSCQVEHNGSSVWKEINLTVYIFLENVLSIF